MLNRITLVGRLGGDPELKYTPQGTAVATFGLAVERDFKDKQGERQVDWFNVVCWRKCAEFASQYTAKGRLVSIDGQMQTRTYVTQAGENRKVYEVLVEHINLLDRPKETASTGTVADDGASPGDPFTDE